MGYFNNYPHVGAAPNLGIAEALIAAAQRKRQKVQDAEAMRHTQVQEEQARGQLDRQNRLADLQIRDYEGKAQRQQVEDQAKAESVINDYSNPISPKYNPEMAGNYARAYGIRGFHQVLPEKPVVPSVSQGQLPPQLRSTLELGSQMQSRENAGDLRGGDLADPFPPQRPPTPHEFTEHISTEGQKGPAYGEQGEAGPFTPEQRGDLRQRETIRSAFQDPRYVAAATDYLAKRKQAQADTETYPARLAEAQSNPVYEGSGPSGPVRFAPIEREKAVQRIHDEAAGRIAAYAAELGKTDPYLASEIKSVEAGVRNRLVTPEEAQKQLNFLLTQRNALTKAQTIAAGMAGAARVKAGAQDRTGERNDLKLMYDQVKDWKATSDFKGSVKSFHELDAAFKNSSSSNSMAQKGVQFALGRKINGPGVFTDQDRVAILDRITGIMGRAENWLQQMENGELGPDVAAVVRDAAAIQLRDIKTKISKDQESFDAQFLAPDSPFASMRSAVENARRGLFGLAGGNTDVSGVSPGTTTLGKGAKRPTVSPSTVKAAEAHTDTAMVRQLSEKLQTEKDPQRRKELLETIHELAPVIPL